MRFQKKILGIFAGMTLAAVLLSACSASSTQTKTSKTGIEDGVLTVAMEAAYAPYNWTQSDDSNGAVPIKGSSDFANGYDVMIAKKIAQELGVTLEIVRTDWDSIVPSVQAGTVDVGIAGQSMTKERMQAVDFAGPYFYASVVVLTKQDSPFANAKKLSDLAGAKGTAQLATIWYNNMLPQIKGANIQPASESAPAMLVALQSGTVDFVCTDVPTAQGALAAYPNLKILDFTDSEEPFVVDEGDINIGISLQKGNTELKDKINEILKPMTKDDFTELMGKAIEIQPISEKN